MTGYPDLFETGKRIGAEEERARILNDMVLYVVEITAEDCINSSVFDSLVEMRLKCFKAYQRIVKGKS